MEKVFICPAEDLTPVCPVARDFERVRVAVYRDGGALCAIDDICPHRQGHLSEGPVEGGYATCPLHAWQFHLRTGEMRGNPAVKIRTFEVVEENGGVYVLMNEPPGQVISG